MKHEWRKHEKNLYIPKNKPELVEIPQMQFFAIRGQGNPNDPAFADYIAVLYALSYAVKMSRKSDNVPEGYFEYTVYPLEGVWDLTEEGIKNYTGELDKNELAYNLMIRQPEFVNEEITRQTLERTKIKKPLPLLEQVEFLTLIEGKCVQMLHLGSYDNEKQSFEMMESFCLENNLKRIGKNHREIYLSDARKTVPEKLKTVLRFYVE
jgi:hypothetical protein